MFLVHVANWSCLKPKFKLKLSPFGDSKHVIHDGHSKGYEIAWEAMVHNSADMAPGK